MPKIGDRLTVPARWFFVDVEGTVTAEVKDIDPERDRYILWYVGRNAVVNGSDLPKTEEAPLFERIAASIVAFYARFELQPTHEDTRNVLREEFSEYSRACNDLLYDRAVNPEKVNLIDERKAAVAVEFGDLIYTAVGHALKCGLTPEELLMGIETVIQKNDAKTAETHDVVILPNGAKKIQRIGREDYDAGAWDE